MCLGPPWRLASLKKSPRKLRRLQDGLPVVLHSLSMLCLVSATTEQNRMLKNNDGAERGRSYHQEVLPDIVAVHPGNVFARGETEDRLRQSTSSSPSTARSIRPLRQHFSKQWIFLVLVDVMHPNVSAAVVSRWNGQSRRCFPYLCRLSGRGYLCSLSGQNGQT